METEKDPMRSLADAKEIKVKIPVEYHIKLHTLKVLKGQSISDTVEAALGRYFTSMNDGMVRPASMHPVETEIAAPALMGDEVH
ncbi:MAG: hypothetical protein HY556_06730 [Euryarchaeota archaeon]|nr:hypothetical protein [Euryarchaeota archaeon]